jgi:TetR/AcrR family transcriptional regulator
MTAERTGRRAAWEQMTREGVRDAVVRILVREGAPGLTMERVAAEAGMAKATLYAYFHDKRQLLDWVKEESFASLREQSAALLRGNARPDQKLRDLIALQLGYFEANADLFRVLLWDLQTSLADLKRHRSRSRFRLYLEWMSAVVRDGIDAGIFRSMDPEKTAALIADAIVAMNRQRLTSESPPTPAAADAQLLTELLLHGLVAPGAGREGKA